MFMSLSLGFLSCSIDLYFCFSVIKIVWYWHKNGYIDQWNRIKSPERNSHLHEQLLYDKGGRIYNGEKTASSTNGVGKTRQLHEKESNWTTFSYHL